MADLKITHIGKRKSPPKEVFTCQDRELEQVILVESKDSFELLRKLKSDNCLPATAPLDRVPFLLGNGHGSGFIKITKRLLVLPFFRKTHEKMKHNAAHRVKVVVNLLRLGLHDNINILKSVVYQNLKEALLSGETLPTMNSCIPAGGLAPSTSLQCGLRAGDR